jgi:hypothetical protein
MASSPTLNAKTIYTQLKNASAKGQLGKTMKRLGGKDVFRIKDELGQGMMHLASSEGNLTFIESLANSKWESAMFVGQLRLPLLIFVGLFFCFKSATTNIV